LRKIKSLKVINGLELDMSKGKTNLTMRSQIRDIYRTTDLKYKDLAKMFGISLGAVQKIMHPDSQKEDLLKQYEQSKKDTHVADISSDDEIWR